MKKRTSLLIFTAAALAGGLVGCSEEGAKNSSSSSDSASSSASSSSSVSSSSASSSSDSSSSSEAPKHTHSYNEDHICPTDGYSEPGALSVDLDGSLDDAKWTALDKTNSLFDLGEDGRGLKIKGFTDDTLAYFAFEIISNTDSFANVEIIFNGDIDSQTTVTINDEGYTNWGDNFIGAVAKTNLLDDGHYQTIVEIAAKLSVLAPSGNLSAAFGAVMNGEKSSSSYSDTQIEYWVLKGINPWGGSSFSVTKDGIEHIHSYQDGKCVWCDAAIPDEQMIINPDGDPSDWNADIAKKYIGTDDGEGRHFGWNAFTDDTYLYVTSTLIHQSQNVTKLNMLRLPAGATDAVEETVASYSGSGYSFGGSGFVAGDYKEVLDEASGMTKTVFEIVFLKDSWLVNDKINIGLLAWVPSSSDESLHFDINHSGLPGYWGITSAHNAWGAGGRFDVTNEGVIHEHSYVDGKCLLCGEDDPNAGSTYDITVDGDFSDWDAGVLATKVSDSDPAGPAISIVGFAKNNNIYLALEATHKESVYFTLVTKDAKEIYFAESDGKMSTPSGGSYIKSYAFANVTDEETGYVTTKVEAVLDLEKIENGELGYAVQAMGDETSSVLHLASNGWTGHMWVIKQLNPWGYRFGFDENGLTHTHAYSDGKCKICGADEPEPEHTPTITADGSLDDFSDAAKNTKIANSASNGEGISLIGFADDYYAYIGVVVKTTSASVAVVDLCGVDNSKYIPCHVTDGVISTDSADATCGSTRSYDEATEIYTYTFEIAVLKSAFGAATDGSVQIGISVNGCSSNAELTCNSNDPTYWGINHLNAWWGAEHCFIFSATGVAAPAKA